MSDNQTSENIGSEAPTASDTPITPLEAPEDPINADTPVQVNNDNQEIKSSSENESIPTENLPAEAGPEPMSPEPVSVPTSSEAGTGQNPVSDPLPVSSPAKPTQKDLWQKFLAKVQIGKRKKLEKIMTLFLKQKAITNDEVEKLLHVSDKTAERYLDILEKENRIKQVGKTGHAVSYTKI